MSFPILWSFAAGLAAALILVPLARRASSKVGMVSQPVPDRWHQRPVGKLGGVAMAAALALLLPFTGMWTTFWPLLLTTGLMFAIGLVDDLRPVRPVTKLAWKTCRHHRRRSCRPHRCAGIAAPQRHQAHRAGGG